MRRVTSGITLLFLLLSHRSVVAQTIRPLEGTTPIVMRPPEECVGVVRPESAGRGPTPGYTDVTPYVLVMPPTDLVAKLRPGDTLTLTIIYSVTGTVDSVTISGAKDVKAASKGAAQIRKVLEQRRYFPARFDGCHVRGIQEYKFSGGPGSSNQRPPLQRSWKNP